MTGQSFDAVDNTDMERLAAGSDAALSALMERHGEKLFHYLIRLLQDETDAADLAQETFVRVYQKRDKFDGRGKFSTWLYSIATNLARDRLRWRMRHPNVSLEAESEETGHRLADALPADTVEPSVHLEKAEQADAVRKAIAALPEEQRIPLFLAEYDDKSHSEIAAILNCSAKAVENHLYRARQRLRQMLMKVLR